ncbi:DUF6475 domain-containing protein [Chitinasiproducens palmae]|uniref:DUF6475 domain-containing protein n=1 Tax=Chitinasiproducens palmae TaxID=1770053 RepID=A0A1H2PQR2_9BURK|nr:DUF6475 domain-containing protein [Chitinasiproducens palmae]SDV49085.1 hypothetical protein SAMN05216551_10754 [Chitinasiproducens palmae]
MKPSDIEPFTALMAEIHAFYRQDFSEFAAGVWISAMRPFDFAAVRDALNRHCVNPDNGQFMPKPADVVRMLEGSTQDSALTAWAKIDRSVRLVGTYRSVVFDDALIHHVVAEMGGWSQLGVRTEDEWPFVRNEFVNRYRGYRMRGEVPAYLAVLVGVTDAANRREGLPIEPPVLVGDKAACERVLSSGGDKPAWSFHQVEQRPTSTARLADREMVRRPRSEPNRFCIESEGKRVGRATEQ